MTARVEIAEDLNKYKERSDFGREQRGDMYARDYLFGYQSGSQRDHAAYHGADRHGVAVIPADNALHFCDIEKIEREHDEADARGHGCGSHAQNGQNEKHPRNGDSAEDIARPEFIAGVQDIDDGADHRREHHERRENYGIALCGLCRFSEMKLLLEIGLLRLFFSALARAAVRADAGFLINNSSAFCTEHRGTSFQVYNSVVYCFIVS